MTRAGRRRRGRGLVLALGAAGLLGAAAGGCGRTLPPTRHYRLSLPTEAMAAEPGLRCADGRLPTIAVEELEVEAAYDDPRIVYRESEYRLERYDYHLWSAAPGPLVSDALRSGYAATGRFSDVAAGWQGDVDAIVRGRLLALEEVDRSRTEWLAHVALRLELVDARTEARLWSERYEATLPLPERSPTGLAAAASALLGRFAEASAAAISARLVERPGGCAGGEADADATPRSPSGGGRGGPS